MWNGGQGKYWIDDIVLKTSKQDTQLKEKLFARPVFDATKDVSNGGFELYDGHRAKSYLFHDSPGERSFIDRVIFHNGAASLRFENFRWPERKHGRVCQEVEVLPWRQYSLSCYVRTHEFEADGGIMLQVYSETMQHLGLAQVPLQGTAGWTKIDILFNSLDSMKVRFYIGAWKAKTGKLWIDDIVLEEQGLLNLLRRPGTPVVVRNALTGEEYVEGKDYGELVDSFLSFQLDHEPPEIDILAGGGIRDGDKLSVSFFHGLTWGNKQVGVTMSENKLYEIWENQLKLLQQILVPKYFFLSMDEIRQGGTDASDQSRNLSMAQILGDCITRQYRMIKDINPEAGIFIWSDMLDPHHNAKDSHCQVRGTFAGSWHYVPKDITVVCWNHGKREDSLKHFFESGFGVLAAAYYDEATIASSADWVKSLEKYSNGIGMMYTTWKNQYHLLPEFGNLMRQSSALPGPDPSLTAVAGVGIEEP
jgi:hypothetical protein